MAGTPQLRGLLLEEIVLKFLAGLRLARASARYSSLASSET